MHVLQTRHPPHVEASLTPQEQKLHKAAAEFEAQLLSSLWKSMKSSFSSDDASNDPASQSLQDWGIDAMSGAVSRAGGMGIGNLIVKDLTEKLHNSQNGKEGASGIKLLAKVPIDSM